MFPLKNLAGKGLIWKLPHSLVSPEDREHCVAHSTAHLWKTLQWTQSIIPVTLVIENESIFDLQV